MVDELRAILAAAALAAVSAPSAAHGSAPPAPQDPSATPEAPPAEAEAATPAEEAATPAEEAATPAEAEAAASAKGAEISTDEEDEESPFGWFSLAPEVGFAYYPAADIEVRGFPLEVQPRNAFVFKLHLDLGGDGLALALAPLVAVERSGGSLADVTSVGVDLSQGVGDGLGGDYVALGGELSLVYRFEIGSFFPHLGIGFHGAYLTADSIEYGAELYGRVPIGFSWYVAEHLAIVLEAGLMYGATGIRGTGLDDPAALAAEVDVGDECTDPQTLENDPELATQCQAAVEDQMSEKLQFGTGFAFDVMIGLRFP